jgi:hypothetical protein
MELASGSPPRDPAASTAPPSRAAAPSPRCPVQPPLLRPGDAGAGCNSEDEREREKEPEERIELLLDVESTTCTSVRIGIDRDIASERATVKPLLGYIIGRLYATCFKLFIF